MTDEQRGQGTVYIVDDDASVCRSLTRLLAAEGYATIAFEAPQTFLELRERAQPACLILDIRMPGLNGLELQARLAETHGGIPIIFLTGHGDVSASVQALKRGAVDFLEKPADAGILLAAVLTAMERDRQALGQRAGQNAARQRVALLTPRECEILRHVIAGRLNKQIGAELGITEKTVKVHRGRVMAKMGVLSVADLVRLTERAGITPA